MLAILGNTRLYVLSVLKFGIIAYSGDHAHDTCFTKITFHSMEIWFVRGLINLIAPYLSILLVFIIITKCILFQTRINCLHLYYDLQVSKEDT